MTEEYRYKVKHTVPASLLLMVGSVALYVFLVWLLIFELQVTTIKREVWQTFLPTTLSGVLFWFTARRRFWIITNKTDHKFGWRGGFQMLTWGASLALMILSYHLAINHFSTLHEVGSVSQIPIKSNDLYYQIDSVSVDLRYSSERTISKRIRGRNSDEIRLSYYSVVPFRGVDNVWYGIKYSNMYQNGSDWQNKMDYDSFVGICRRNIEMHNFTYQHTFERIVESDDREDFLLAIRRVKSDASSSVVILSPMIDGYRDRSGEFLLWIFGVIGLWVALMLILLNSSPLDDPPLDDLKLHTTGRLF